MSKIVAIVSGGMDSVTLAHLLADEGHELILLSVDYGQRHGKELAYAAKCAARLGVDHIVADIRSLTSLLSGSALTDAIDVPDGHYRESTMRITVVPNRNAIMLSIAAGIAVAKEAQFVATGVHAGDHFIYPDCRPEFTHAFDAMSRIATKGFGDVGLMAPFVEISKGDIARIGQSLNVPWKQTWSCYKGGNIHCGACGTCFERREAMADAGIDDPTEYADTPMYADPTQQMGGH